MANLVITSQSGIVTYSQIIASAQGTADRYWLRATFTDPRYRVEKVIAPGVDGAAIKRHGFDMLTISAHVVYIFGSAATCKTNRTADEATMANEKLSVVVPDAATFESCNLLSVEEIKGPRPAEAGNFIYQLRLTFEQVR